MSLTSLTGYAFEKIAEKQRKNEGKRCNLTVLWEKSFLCLQKPGSLLSAMISDVILIFPPNLRGLPNAKWSDRWCGRLKRLKAAMTWFSLVLERQLKRAIRQGMSSKTLSLVRVRVRVWRTMAFIDWYTLMERGGWGGEQRKRAFSAKMTYCKGYG